MMSSDRETPASPGRAAPLLAFADGLLAEQRQAKASAPADVRQFVTFCLQDEEYGLPILQCREIVRISAITRVPEAPPHVRGVVNLRGHIVPAVDTRGCFGLATASPTPRSRLIVVEVAGRLFALVVDRVARILKLPATAIEPPPEDAALRGVTGVARAGESVIFLLDADRVLHLGPAADGTTARG
jgi:purine-binding chemotaxis protein CheW